MTRLPPPQILTLRPLRRTWRSAGPIWATQAEGASTKPEDLELLKSPAKKTVPPLLFPWRHGTELPERLIQRQELLKNETISYDVSTVGIATMTAAFYFNHVSFFQIFGNQWRTDLAESCSWAFFQGLTSILSKAYNGAYTQLLVFSAKSIHWFLLPTNCLHSMHFFDFSSSRENCQVQSGWRSVH